MSKVNLEVSRSVNMSFTKFMANEQRKNCGWSHCQCILLSGITCNFHKSTLTFRQVPKCDIWAEVMAKHLQQQEYRFLSISFNLHELYFVPKDCRRGYKLSELLPPTRGKEGRCTETHRIMRAIFPLTIGFAGGVFRC